MIFYLSFRTKFNAFSYYICFWLIFKFGIIKCLKIYLHKKVVYQSNKLPRTPRLVINLLRLFSL